MSDSYDVGIQTVIGLELQAIQKQFQIDNDSDRFYQDGDIYWRKTLSRATKPPLEILLYCQGEQGNHAASNAATKCIERFAPHFLVLSGIAAGRRDKVKIGDVAIPRVIADLTVEVAQNNDKLSRPKIPSLPHPVLQLLRAFDLRKHLENWHTNFLSVVGNLPAPPQGKEQDYAKYVSTTPQLHEVAIASDDVLIRDPNHLPILANTIHQQIYIGEMEAAGFVGACLARSPITPWFVVRGVSDFGDDFKDDNFHWLASCSAASYLYQFLSHALDLQIFDSKKKT